MRPVFLIGFPAAGKTTVGRLAAAALGRAFVDLDDEVLTRTGSSAAVLVAADEADFRKHEATALRALIDGDARDTIVATGGGAASHGDNLARMKSAGLVVTLAVGLDHALHRAAGGGRPLLARPRAELEALYARRAPVYRRAHAALATEGRRPEAVAEALVALIEHADLLVHAHPWVCLGERSYPIVVDDGPLASALAPFRRAGVLIADRNLAPWIEPVRAALGDVAVELVEPGEASKSIATYGELAARLVARGLDRASTIYALGGGVVGDLVGFVAATLYRGVAVVHLPTSLVAMTDSAIGGKTAVDLPAGKNLIGAFHQPRAVIAHLPTLTTLPPRERRAGFGELWKYALLDGEALWSATEALAPWARTDAAPPPAARAVIEQAAAIKAAIVSVDEREQSGLRLLLNLGHTVGHAIEAAADWDLLHGECVGLGLIAAARISHRLGFADADLEPRVTGALAATGLPTELAPWLTPATLGRIAVDKKRAHGQLRFIACASLGDCRVVELSPAAFADLLRP